MPQNLVSLALSDAVVQALHGHITQFQEATPDLVALDADTRRGATKMGDKSEAFVRLALLALDQNREIVPPALELDEALADLRALDQIRPLRQRVAQLLERLEDTEMALGSDAMATALEGYALLRVSGKSRGLDGLRDALSTRFSRSRKPPAPPAA